uniref:Uncharacterized protein n=1 Tax=candidate division CPR3 bacterium TaxID=2268181 RepID=A0A7C5YW77_UNCC3
MLDERDYVEEKRIRRTDGSNQNIDAWRRINKDIEEDVSIPKEIEEDQEFSVEEETPERIIQQPEKKKKRTSEISVLETGFTASKKAPPISQIDAGTSADVSSPKRIYYAQKLNPDSENELPKVVLSATQENLPDGVANQYEETTITIKINFYKTDWDKIYRVIKSQRDTIKQFARRAMVQATDEILERNKIKKRLIEELSQREVLAELKEKLTKELIVERTIWQSRYKERDPDAVRLYPELNEEVKKDLEEEEQEKEQLLKRLQRLDDKRTKKEAKEARARARALQKQPEDNEKEIEMSDDIVQEDLENMQNGPGPLEDSALNNGIGFDTEGVMPEEICEEVISDVNESDEHPLGQ